MIDSQIERILDHSKLYYDRKRDDSFILYSTNDTDHFKYRDVRYSDGIRYIKVSIVRYINDNSLELVSEEYIDKNCSEIELDLYNNEHNKKYRISVLSHTFYDLKDIKNIIWNDIEKNKLYDIIFNLYEYNKSLITDTANNLLILDCDDLDMTFALSGNGKFIDIEDSEYNNYRGEISIYTSNNLTEFYTSMNYFILLLQERKLFPNIIINSDKKKLIFKDSSTTDVIRKFIDKTSIIKIVDKEDKSIKVEIRINENNRLTIK